jgi:WD40 repeat protein
VADLVSSDVTHLALWQPGTGSAPCTTIHQSGMVRSWSLGGRFPRATVEFERGSSPGADGCEARGDRLVVASGRNAIVHSLATLAPLEALRGHEDVVNWVDQSSDGQWIATASMDCTACIWSAETSGEPRWSFPHEDPLWVAEFSPDGRWLATAGEAGRILLFDFLSGEPPVELFSNGRGLRCLRFDATGRRLVSVSEMDGWVRVFDLESRNEIASFFPGKNDMPTRRSGSPHSACFHPDGQRVAITTFGGRVLVWDVRGGEPIQAKLEVGPKTMDVEFSPDGTLLAVCGPAFAAQLLAADDLREIATLPGHAGAPIGLSFANEGRELVTLDTRNDVRVWPVDVVAAARRTLRSLEPIGLAAR